MTPQEIKDFSPRGVAIQVMKEERIRLLKKTVLGEYVRLKCKNCGKKNGTFTHAKFFCTDCDCTLLKTGNRFRTTNDTLWH